MRIYIGYDEREKVAWEVAAKSFRRFGHTVIPIYEERLRLCGILTRPLDRRDGKLFDLNSNAPQSTEFAISRFAVPMLAHAGWAMFADSDVVAMRDPEELMPYVDPAMAVSVVKHQQRHSAETKMRGQVQTVYPRKNWSSIAVYNCDHPANQRINLHTLNQWPGRYLHAFGWLADSEIGELPSEANWLVGEQEKPERPIIAHFTMGTPDMPGKENSPHAEIWYEARAA